MGTKVKLKFRANLSQTSIATPEECVLSVTESQGGFDVTVRRPRFSKILGRPEHSWAVRVLYLRFR